MSETADSLLDSALEAARRGELPAAEGFARQASEAAPEDPRPRLLMAELLLGADRVEAALSHFAAAAALDPANPTNRLKLGLTLRRLGRDDEAEEAYRSGLAAAPRAPALNQAFGMLLYQQGRLTEAAGPFEIARAAGMADPFHCAAATAFALGTLDDLGAPPFGVELAQRLGETLLWAAHRWLRGDVEGCAAECESLTALLPQVPEAPGRGLAESHARLLSGLVAWRRERPEAYETDGAEATLYLVGDSHVLPAANLVAQTGGRRYRLQSRLVLSGAARQLVEPSGNPAKGAFTAIAGRLPAGAEVAFSFGELDCRVATGIVARKLRDPDLDGHAEVERLARAYAEWALSQAEAYDWRARFVIFPKSRVAEGLLAAEIRQLFGHVRERFPALLRELAGQAGVPVIDLFEASQAPASAETGNLFIDQHYTTPAAFLRALARSA